MLIWTARPRSEECGNCSIEQLNQSVANAFAYATGAIVQWRFADLVGLLTRQQFSQSGFRQSVACSRTHQPDPRPFDQGAHKTSDPLLFAGPKYRQGV